MACSICHDPGHNRRTHSQHAPVQGEALLDPIGPAEPEVPTGADRAREALKAARGDTHQAGRLDMDSPDRCPACDVRLLDGESFLCSDCTAPASSVVPDEEDPGVSAGQTRPPDNPANKIPADFNLDHECEPAPDQVYFCRHCGEDLPNDDDPGMSTWSDDEPLPSPPWRTVLGPDEPIRITLPGVYILEAHEYHDSSITGDWLSNSDARQLIDDGCPAQFRYDRDNGVHKTSAAFSMGHAVHARILGKGETIAVRPADFDSWRTNAAKAWRAEQEAAGRSVILPEDAEIVEAMATAVHEHERAHELLSQPGRPEVALFWVDPVTGVKRRCLVDYLPDQPDANGVMRVVDLKSADEVAPNDKMERKLYDHCWHRQAVTIADGVVELGLAAEVDFHFIVQSKRAPHLVTVVRIDADAERIGGIENRRAIEVYKRCVETGVWPSFTADDDVVTLAVPPYIAARFEDEIEVSH